MGYRLSIKCKEILKDDIRLEFPKFYGYISDEDVLKTSSFRFLMSKGYVNEDDAEMYTCNGEIPCTLSAEDFRIFITLYNIDLNIYEHDHNKYIWANHKGGYYFCKDRYVNRLVPFHDLFWSNYDKKIFWG